MDGWTFETSFIRSTLSKSRPKNSHGDAFFFTRAQIHNGPINFHQILHIHFLGGRSDIFESLSKLVQGFWEGVGVKFGIGF